MSQAQLPYVLLYLCSTFLSAVSQVLLKKAALLPSAGLVKAGTVVRVSRVVADSLIASGAAEEPPVKVETKKAAPRRRAAKAS